MVSKSKLPDRICEYSDRQFFLWYFMYSANAGRQIKGISSNCPGFPERGWLQFFMAGMRVNVTGIKESVTLLLG